MKPPVCARGTKGEALITLIPHFDKDAVDCGRDDDDDDDEDDE